MGKKTPKKSKRILIIDDDPQLLAFLQGETLKRGLNCHFENTALFSKAVALLFSKGYDLVLLDFPGIRGPYLLNMALLRELPVFVLASPSMFPVEALHLQEKGIKAIIPKENFEELLSLLVSFFQPIQLR